MHRGGSGGGMGPSPLQWAYSQEPGCGSYLGELFLPVEVTYKDEVTKGNGGISFFRDP